MVSEIWIAVCKEESNEEDNPYIIFEVEDENTNRMRIERRYERAVPLMLMLGGYPSVMGAVMLMQPLPWRFRKVDDNIYIDGPSVGVENYHPITDQE